MSCYSAISQFGPGPGNSPQDNPLTYCAVSQLEAGFQNTLGNTLLSPYSSQCQVFMSQYCANNWDGVCENKSNDFSNFYPNAAASCDATTGTCGRGSGIGNPSTYGDILLRNTASEKYLRFMSDNCQRDYEPFDPTVAGSPMISRWRVKGNCQSSGKCIPIYDVDEKTINQDPVMNKILSKPWIAMDILINIYNYRKQTRRLENLRGTRLYQFFASPQFTKH